MTGETSGDQIEHEEMKCDVCNEILYADEEWAPKPGLDLNEPAGDNDYIHADCYTEAL